jgi:glycosyltransferase involved in cell wall biosynthesis
MRDLAVEFLNLGHEPLVIVPSGGLLKDYTSIKLDGVDVYRLPSLKIADVNFVRRGIGEFLMPFSMLWALRRTDFPTSKLDLVVWYSPSIFFGPLVWYLKSRSSCKGYLILRDMFPEWLVDLGMMKKGIIYYIFRLVAKFQYQMADCIGVQTTSNLSYFTKWLQSGRKKIEVLDNWLFSNPVVVNNTGVIDDIFPRRKIFVYIGNMGVPQGMDILIELAGELRERLDIGFLFMGRGTEKKRLESIAKDMDLTNIVFHEEIDSSEIPALLQKCHVGLIALDPKHKSHNIPGKFISYIRSGLPVLARVNPGTDLINLIEANKIGAVYTGGDVKEFSKIAVNLLHDSCAIKNMGIAGKLFFEKKYSVEKAASNIILCI